MKYLLIILIMILTFFLLKKLIKLLIEQSKKPNGILGIFFIKIWNKTYDKLVLWSINPIENKHFNTVLDIGYGGGQSLQILSEKINTKLIYGIDVSATAYEYATKLNKEKIANDIIKVSIDDVQNLSFNNNQFDLVTAFQTHFHWSNLIDSLSEIHRTMKDDGLLIIACEKNKLGYHLPEYKSSHQFDLLMRKFNFKRKNVYENKDWICYYYQLYFA